MPLNSHDRVDAGCILKLSGCLGADRGGLAERCLPGFGSVAGGTQQNLPGVLELARHEARCQVQAEFAVTVMIMLGNTQVRVASERAAGPGQESPCPGEPCHRPVIGCAPVHQVVGDGYSAERHDMVDADQRQAADLRLIRLVDADGIVVEVQAGARSCDIEAMEEFSRQDHPPPIR
jgi:hypothetical protein